MTPQSSLYFVLGRIPREGVQEVLFTLLKKMFSEVIQLILQVNGFIA